MKQDILVGMLKKEKQRVSDAEKQIEKLRRGSDVDFASVKTSGNGNSTSNSVTTDVRGTNNRHHSLSSDSGISKGKPEENFTEVRQP